MIKIPEKYQIKKENLDGYQKLLEKMEKARSKKWDIHYEVYEILKKERDRLDKRIAILRGLFNKKRDALLAERGYDDIKVSDEDVNELKRVIGRIKQKFKADFDLANKI
jgi:hypothetical protein